MSNRFPPQISISHPVVDGDDHDLLPGGKSLPTHHDLHQHFASMIIICHRHDYDHDDRPHNQPPECRCRTRHHI